MAAATPASGPMTPGAAPAATGMKNGFGITAMCCGIVGVVIGVIPFTFFVSIPLGVCGIVFGALGLRRAKHGEASNRAMAMTGFVTGIVACGLAIAYFFIFVAGASTVESDLEYYAHHPSPQAMHTLVQDEAHLLRQGMFIGNL